MKIVLIILFILQFTLLNSQVTLTDSNLPIVIITTENSAPILDDPRVVAHMGVIDNGAGIRNYLTDPFTNYDGRIEIEIRGSTSQQYPKKGYGLETQDALGMNSQISLLGMPPENDWILYGPYPDKTLIRNALTFDLSRQMGHYAPATRYCELLINGNYRGVYVMMERIKRDIFRVNVDDIHVPNFWSDTISGGYIMKVDKLTGDVDFSWASNYNSQVLFQFHDPEYFEIYPVQRSYMMDYLDDFEDAMWGVNFADPLTGYPYYIDRQSFQDFFILQELGRTVDGYRSSSFLHKDKNSSTWNAKLIAGPMWDFNLSYGNADYCGADGTTGWQYNFDDICGTFSTSIPFWWQRLQEDPAYANSLRCRWEALRNGALKTSNINVYIDSLALKLEEGRIRNFQRWPIIGVYVNWNGFVGQTYQEDVDYLKTYIEQRSIWIDNNLGGNCTMATKEIKQEDEFHRAWPNPANEELYIGFTIFETRNVEFLIQDLTGKIVISEAIGSLSMGKHAQLINVNSLELGTYYYSIKLDGSTTFTGKIIKL